MTDPPIRRPFGAVPVADGLVEFRVWAPSATRVDVRLDDGDHDLTRVTEGVHEGRVSAMPGDDYRYVLDGGEPLPDPWSRFQPDGIFGPSRIVDTAQLRVVGRRLGGRPARRARALRAARRHLHRGRHLRGRDPAPARARRPRRDRDRADAGGDVPRRPRLGVRRDLRLRPAPGLRRPGRAHPLRRRRARRGPRRAPRRRLQPRRPRSPLRRLRPVLHRPPPHVLGRGDRLLAGRRARVGAAERGVLDPRLPPRRPPPRRHARRLRRPPAPRPGRARRPCPRRRPARARHLRDDDRRPAPDRGVGARRAVGGRAPPRAARAPHRRARGLLRRLPRLRGGDRAPAPARPGGAARRLHAEPRPDRQPPVRRPSGTRAAAAAGARAPLRAADAAAVHGPGARRPRAVPVLHRPRRPVRRRRHPRRPPQRVRGLRGLRRPRTCPTRRPGTRSCARS